MPRADGKPTIDEIMAECKAWEAEWPEPEDTRTNPCPACPGEMGGQHKFSCQYGGRPTKIYSQAGIAPKLEMPDVRNKAS